MNVHSPLVINRYLQLEFLFGHLRNLVYEVG